MGSVEDFINSDFTMPDLSDIGQTILSETDKYITENLTKLNLDE